MVSPCLSLVAAGVASGICFLIFSNVLRGKPGDPKQGGKQIPVDENRCACCLKPFFLSRGVRCNDCGARSCRKGCSRWDTTDNAWHCLFCRQQRYWLNKTRLATSTGLIDEKDLHRHFNTAKSRVYVAGVENAAASSGVASAGEKEEANTMETIRDFVEKLVEGLIGNVDDAPINRLYDHPAYDKLLEKNILPLTDALTRLAMALQLSVTNKSSTDSPTMAHTALRDIVERAVEEARKLPGLGGSCSETGRPQEARDIAEHSYEDLLATAILNKVIEKYQKEQVDGNSNVLNGKPVPAAKCALSESEIGFDEGVEEGCSSLEPLSQDECGSECSASCSRHHRNHAEPLSLTIEERIEEVTTTYASDEYPRDNDVLAIRNAHRVPFPELGMDIIDPSQESSEDSQDEPGTLTPHIGLISPIESWEENWLFQKKRVQTQADPVAMLVPNPSADFKALIGDKDAEDTSDLSECSSAQSDEEIEKELMEAIINVVPRSPKESQFENGLDSCLEASGDVSMKGNHAEALSNNACAVNQKADGSENTGARVPMRPCNEQNKSEGYSEGIDRVRRAEVREEDIEQKVKVNEAKEVEKPSSPDCIMDTEGNSVKADTKQEKPAAEWISVISNEVKMIELERRVAHEKSEEDAAGNATNVEDPTNAYQLGELEDTVQNNSSNSNESARSPTAPLLERNASNVPKTPTSTPTGISMAEANLESENDAEVTTLRDERVLSSLECAKMKLMAVDRDAAEPIKDDAKCIQLRADFHAEDIQQESEYTEHYDIATQRHLDSLTKTDTSVVENGTTDDENVESKCRAAVALVDPESASQLSLRNRKSEEEIQLATPPRPGTIAEREHKKWENAAPIENNPYSEENIQKRLWERQYSRRSSDIPGIHAELPKSNGADLEVVLAHQEPDIKRFGRDYYINDSRASSNEKGRRSAASTSSRPSSSLSQRSSSTGADQEHQVSYQLEKFEAASLRGSLSRRTYRDPYSSPHFAINPLLRMDLDDSEPTRPTERSNDRVESDDAPGGRPLSVERRMIAGKAKLPTRIAEDGRETAGSGGTMDRNSASERSIAQGGSSNESLRVNDDFAPMLPENSCFALNGSAEKVAYNPLYIAEENITAVADRCNPDGDSGMYSIDPRDVEDSKEQDQDCYKRLWVDEWDRNAKENQILSANGRRYWSFDGYKYHTFGGIKNIGIRPVEDSDEENSKPGTPDESSSFDLADFAKLKFQTFGGIKGNRKIDGKGIPTYRKVKLRSSSRGSKSKSSRHSLNESILQNENGVSDTENEGKDTVYENFDSRAGRKADRQVENSKRFQSRQAPRHTRPSSYRSSSDDDWQDEVLGAQDKMMSKFIKDASRKARLRPRSEDSVYFLNTSRRKVFDDGPKKLGSQSKLRTSDDNESLKLEPPIEPEVVERTFETLRDLRVNGRKKKQKCCEHRSSKKLGVRSLSDVTIW
ncbi:uncharacterized protein LOC143368149 isoform X3 [Andrena cerasifolii]|uniref:uncharacterized protein LOC143368149 isoform X3 n=1 Tax=Andrena cerasifolii TaxID=2819439 RepID=UPI004037C227